MSAPSTVAVPKLDSENAVREALSLMKHLDKGELQEIMDSEENLDNILRDLEEIKKIEVNREMLTASNRSLAEFNLKIEPQLNQGRQQLIEAHERREMLQAQFQSNKAKLDTLSDQYSSDTTTALLQTAVAQAEEDSEKTVDTFLDGKMSMEDFIQTFMPQKALHHLRRVKAEKLTELLQQRRSGQCSYKF
ncbi:predicted protein [Nematostella vectensis]|uniref:VPS37 C-terminal domain-containing protein n=1 Tax=Nematostella vectensis TaxID=45351 RepID=A7SWG3_NEMVE|nr:vacuolar protein sorting-associated protein 37B [Nematostella vectensis]EDO31948.1 predicted protein [Nematostella vectensis]|eukprot:XP_001624048.1 predicted protein [Nematostella vectensis]